MMYNLAIDIGASSGRHILGWIEDGVLQTKEIYRFENSLKREKDSLVWDMENLVSQVKLGIKRCSEIGCIPETIAIDTWGVDYVLLDKNEEIISPVYCYRDSRTEKVVSEVFGIISEKRLYEITGIQKQSFNTVFQLYSDKVSGRLEKAEHFMMIPEYLSYCLTGIGANEYTNATTTGMVNAETGQWDEEIINALGFDKKLFKPLTMPGTEIGRFNAETQSFVGFDASVIFCPSHDTGSAVVACPLEENGLYISSGTWSLIGMELPEPILTEEARTANFTNEGGYARTIRLLKNYMGMWLLQNIRSDLNKEKSYDEMMYLAMESESYEYFDVNSPELLAPDNMIEAIRSCLKKPDMPIENVLNSVYHSLARSYENAVKEIESLTGKSIAAIHIVGGGCQDKYLNRLTSEYTGKCVTAGPIEATAIGNLIAQIIYTNSEYTLKKARQLVCKSFKIEEV